MKKTVILNCDHHSPYYCFYCIFDQINYQIGEHKKNIMHYIYAIRLWLWLCADNWFCSSFLSCILHLKVWQHYCK